MMKTVLFGCELVLDAQDVRARQTSSCPVHTHHSEYEWTTRVTCGDDVFQDQLR